MAMVNKKWTETDVINAAAGEMTVRETEDWINLAIPRDYQMSRGTVHKWLTGESRIPEHFVRMMRIYYPEGDARRILADTLNEMRNDELLDQMEKHDRKAVRG
jgi:hypothetical protein